MIIGKYSYGNPIVHWKNDNTKIVIGNFCSIANNVNIYCGGNHRVDWVTTYPFGHINKNKFNTFNGEGHPSTKGDVIIGNDVWIGANVTIMSGVTIIPLKIILLILQSHLYSHLNPFYEVLLSLYKIIVSTFFYE